ncbi:MAG: transglutaminase domain-containing protein [Eubacteriales bacterium]|nr:transglutaminase domain-containing protein [Eubacteriales bacterium]
MQKHNNKKKRNKRRFPIYIAGGVLVLCIAAVVTLLILYTGIHFEYCVELGDPVPSAEVFSKSGDTAVEYITDISGIDVSETGNHWLHISVNGKDRLVNLVVKDTIPPEAQPVELNISIDEEIAPDQLIKDLHDAGIVKLQWEKAPEFGTVGDYSVVIKMCDMSGNTASVTSLLHIRAVVDTLTYEAGSALPALQAFLADATLDAKFITDLATLPLDTPGQYDVSIEVNGAPYTSCLIVTDTVEPEITMQMVYIHPGEQAKPEDFVSSASDASALSFEFLAEPDYDIIGFQEVRVIATDLGGNTVELAATLLISNVAPVTVEIRGTPLTAEEFADGSSYGTVTLAEEMIPDTLGEYDVDLILDGETNPTRVTVIDTTPPEAEAVDVAWYLAHPLSADNFVKNAFDYTEITYAFSEEPDWDQSSVQNVTVVLTDAAGNKSEYTSSLTLGYDTEAPSLYGVKDRYCYIGQAVAYFAEVFAEDNCDFEVSVDVDNSNVDIYSAGAYEVTYSATDTSGNTVTKSCEFTFVEETVTDEELDAAAQQVLSEIITDDMSIGYQAYAVFEYVNSHVKYSGTSNKADWKYEAYRGITSGRGDCFTFYAVAKCLLEKIGAQTMCVERHGGNRTTHHYWLLVNLGTGWYHFDAINVGPRQFECFMRTDHDIAVRAGNFWSFDHSLYPSTPDEPYVLE